MERLARVFRRAREGVREVFGSIRLSLPVRHAHGAVMLVVAGHMQRTLAAWPEEDEDS